MTLAKIEIIVGTLGLVGTGWLSAWLDTARFGPALFIQGGVLLMVTIVGMATAASGEDQS